MATDPEIRAHLQWLGYLQPVGLVVSAPALAAAGAYVNKNIVREQQTLIALAKPSIDDFPRFCREFLGWEAADLSGGPGGPELPRSLDVALPEYGEVLSPTYAVPDPDQKDRWLMLIQVLPRTLDLDEVGESHRDDRHWHASPQARFDRLLRENDIPIGLLSNGTHLRLVYAPANESTGHLTFPVAAMCEVAGRPIVAALHMLLAADRLFTVPTKQRLPAILKDSRRYQNQVSTRLAEQIQSALWELLRGFQAANEANQGALLKDVLREAPQEVYGGLLGTLMRLVFILFAEDRGLLSDDPVYQGHYSVNALFERLRDESARYPDTMDQRFGAWAQLLTLFRLIHDGAAHGSLKLPARHGRLFNPDTWDFLEGRPYGDILDRSRKIPAPRVSDSVVFNVLDNLMVLDGERISYRALDVEQIGSVYEAMMGYELQEARGPSIGVKPDHVVVDIAPLLQAKPADRLKTLRDEAKCDLTGKAADAVKAATTPEELVAALGKKVSPRTPTPIAPGGLYLQPTEERRRSGSHYTPRSLTEPIVRTTLEPIVKALGDKPTPDKILDLKVCDPAMGSGAFLVEACRYLENALVRSWDLHGSASKLPPDEDLHTHARRLIASRCLYGVDKNPFAVDLAKLSLWLATLAKDHPFTFLDHSLRHGDSLVGLSREQIASFHWAPEKQAPLIHRFIDEAIREAQAKRAAIHALGDEGDTESKARLHDEAVAALEDVRRAGDLAIAAFLAREKPKDREALRVAYAGKLQAVLDGQTNPKEIDDLIDSLRKGDKPVPPFHWEIEFPEVFSRDNPGFDAYIGNPPFAGKNTLIASTRDAYPAWLKTIHEESHGNSDLIAHFYRRAFSLLRKSGTFGLIATNTIAQGDTRASGLRWICTHGGTIYAARKRVKWPAPGAAVVVSVVHIGKGPAPGPCILDGKPVERVTAFLFHDGGHEDPAPLPENAGKSFIGSYVLGMGFTFDDDNPDATPVAEMERLIAKDPRNKERIFPYIGGEEVNDSPTHAHRRYVINFGEMTETEARRWPDLMAILEAKVKPERQQLGNNPDAKRRKKNWWLWGRYTPALFEAIRGLDRVLVIPRVSQHHAPAFLPAGQVYSEQLVVIATRAQALFSVTQSRVHELFFRFFGSTHEERPRYTPSDCFETFPFPTAWDTNAPLEVAGRAYYEVRAAVMAKTNEGLTKTYNRFHDPDQRNEADVRRLHELHDAMDRAVLDAYGWADLRPTCDFFLDYEEEESEDDDGKPSKKKKPWRYRWPDEVHDEILARVLALNRERSGRTGLAP
jgi:type I restriction-modification system DNA methylase subunit